MANLAESAALLATLDSTVAVILGEALRAPSAHNAQPWRLVPVGSHHVELHYDHHDYLPFDPDDRDAYLALGAFYETLSLAAQRHGCRSAIHARFSRDGSDLWVGDITIRPARHEERPDALAEPAADRYANRLAYDRTPVPAQLADQLLDLGNVMVEPETISRLVSSASVFSWRDQRFVGDLRRWTRADPGAADGMTPMGLSLSRVEWAALWLAFRAGRLPAPVARLYASRDARLLSHSVAVCVLHAPTLDPADLFEAGRRLLRSWASIAAAGWACHPISIAVDRPETCPLVAALAGVPQPVALYRIGHPERDGPRSNRRTLREVLRSQRTLNE